ncbi:GNAT family N-acetyltransferase [Clostridium sp.]|uniref:GNAT family N-acetyltransferase n=1 Tax=Clostridium sp. TaxID=1506 RepID=UPI002912A554|nr:GNAT family N-acetyltransferase [Clostridium sp.]MDU7242376.1 GNAT family N-acetyltransferase [Clostridium sp.]
MIKNFLELNNDEKILALEFIKKNENTDLSLFELEKELKGKICNYGEGVLFYFDENKIVGKVSVILEIVDKLRIIYINKVTCPKDNKKVLKELINNSLVLSEKYNAKKVLLGIRNNDLLKLAQDIGLKRSYSSFNMILSNREKSNDVLDKIRLSKENIEEYVDVYNKSFMDMPHGTYIEIVEAEGYLENKNYNEDYFIVLSEGERIGFLNTTIKDKKAFFDIGLKKEYRGKGYGKKLLETAIQFLNEKQVEEICLTVIEKNSIAYEMYKKRGFNVYNKLSDWIELM